ncbi:hypothetical protein BGX28_000417 [Mortierella sp. GBA30]|nr:hypothetical protein BGX28_000417 [Mortierella sp. GBA30]
MKSIYRAERDSDSMSMSTTSSRAGPGRAHWKPDSGTLVCTWPGCRLEFGFFDRRHHCRNAHCSREVPLDQALDFNPSEGVMSRACVGCYEAYEQWQGNVPVNSYGTSSALYQMQCESDYEQRNSSTTSSTSSNQKRNIGRIPDGFLGGSSSEEFGREVRQPQPAPGNIAIKKRPSTATHPINQIHTTEDLDRFLQERPSAEELMEKNILKDTNVEPEMQQQVEEIKKVRLEDALNTKLKNRPRPSELIDHNILHEAHMAPSLQRHADELKRSQLEDAMNHKIEHRPPPSELIEHHILHDSNVAPAIQQQTEELKKTQLESALNSKLEHRPSPETLVEKHIL